MENVDRTHMLLSTDKPALQKSLSYFGHRQRSSKSVVIPGHKVRVILVLLFFLSEFAYNEQIKTSGFQFFSYYFIPKGSYNIWEELGLLVKQPL